MKMLFAACVKRVHNFLQGPRLVDNEPGAAVVITIESTQISALSSGSLVSKGKFTGKTLQSCIQNKGL